MPHHPATPDVGRRCIDPSRSSVGVLAVAACLAGIGCQSPLGDGYARSEAAIHRVTGEIIDREIADILAQDTVVITTPAPTPVEDDLAPRRAELDRVTPAMPEDPTPFDLGPNLEGTEQQTLSIALDAAVTSAVRNNLAVRIASLQPAINYEDVVIAQSAFDFVLLANANFQWTDEPQSVPILNGIPLGTPFLNTESYRFDTSLRKRFYSGGELTLSGDVTRFRNNSPAIAFSPDPDYTTTLRARFAQPLLRGFGTDVNTAVIRFAENTEDRAVQQLTAELLGAVEETESAYWTLVLTWLDAEIRQWLVDVGVVVRDQLQSRLDFDVKPSEASDAVAVVEQRVAEVIRSRRRLRAASDRLKLLINDDRAPISDELLLRPTDSFVDTPSEYSLREVLLVAIANRPEIQQALLSIDDAAINRIVADNGRLPVLDVAAEVALLGQDDDASTSFGNAFDDDFVDYVVGLSFEYPLGNRGPEAAFRRARLETAQSVLNYRQTVQNVVFDVKTALRDALTNFNLISATRSFRVAQAENLRALEAEEPLRGLTPEFLNLKFQRQERLALARFEEFAALANFDQSLAALFRAMGTGLRMRNIGVEVSGSDTEFNDLMP